MATIASSGAVLAACPTCGEALPSGARFCPGCGARVDDRAPPARGPQDVGRGERRQVAILFADLSGYTRLSRTLDPEETHRLLTHFFERADEAIERYGGTIDKHIGDAVMAVFGAPVAFGNDVERALRSAVAIHAAMSALSAESAVALSPHIGVASGEVVAAATGGSTHRHWTVTGDAVNLASRLTDLARAGETVISEDVRRAVAALVECEPLRPVALRGFGDDVCAHRLLALRPARASSGFVGRVEERQRFTTLLERVHGERRGATVVIRADPGIGKSRLAAALLADAAASGARCHDASVLDFGAGQGRDAIHALVASLLAIPDRVPAAARREALERTVADGFADAADEPALADILLVPQRDDSLYEAMDSKARQAARLRAFTRVVETAAARNARVLLIEDVHWASPWVLEAARTIAATTCEHPVVLLMTTRRDGDPIGEGWHDVDLVRFELPPLDSADALALAEIYAAGAAERARRCVERAQGNPLFLMQLLENDAADDAVPPTIQSVVLARLDRLAAKDKAALQAAAVVGLRFPIALVRHLLRDPEYAPAVLLARDLVRADDHDASSLTFHHALIRDGAYASLLRSARRELHDAAAAWYESRDPTLYAEHLERAEDPRAAAAYLVAARGEAHAMRTEAALSLASRGTRLQAPAPVRFALSSLVGDLTRELGDAKASVAAFEQALDAADDDAARCRAWIGIAWAHRMTSDVAPGLSALDRAASLAAVPGLVRERAQIAYLRGSLHFARGDLAECRRPHEEALALAREAGDAEIEAWALSGLADALYAQALLRSAHDAFVRCLDICQREAMTRFSLMNHCMLAIIDALFLRRDEARARLARTRRVARDVRHRLAETMCDESEGYILATLGRVDLAAEPAARGLPLARAIGARRFEIILLVTLALVARRAGRLDEARAQLRDAWSLCAEVGKQFAGAIVLGALARCAATRDERRRALRDGEALLREPSIAHCHIAFYRHAIDAALDEHEWSEAERYASLLEAFLAAEPLPLIDLVVARGRALAAAGRDAGDTRALSACRERLIAAGFVDDLVAVDAALARAGLRAGG